jgi:hypothetical protein
MLPFPSPATKLAEKSKIKNQKSKIKTREAGNYSPTCAAASSSRAHLAANLLRD